MKRLIPLLLLVCSPGWAQSTLELDTIPAPGPQTGERFQRNFQSIKDWTNRVDSNNNDNPDCADQAGELDHVPLICPDGTYATGIAANGDATGCAYFLPAVPTDWDLGAALPETLVEAADALAQDKVAIDDTGTITEETPLLPNPEGFLDCVGPQCVHLGNTYPCLWYSTVEGPNGWTRVCAITIGVQPQTLCLPGMLHIDIDETDDDVCATTADNSLCLCVAPDIWAALENN